MGIDVDDLELQAADALKHAEHLRTELRKKESATYVNLIDELNALTHRPVPVQQRYDESLELIGQASLTDWERTDLLAELDRMYGKVLNARPYLQVLASLQDIAAGDLARDQKFALSMQLLESYKLPDDEREDVEAQVRRMYTP
jgi:hypothetical protein